MSSRGATWLEKHCFAQSAPVCESCRAQASMTEGVGPAHGLIRFCGDVSDFFNVSPSPRCGQVCAARKLFCAWYQAFQSVAPGCFLESRMVRSLCGLDALKLASIWCSESDFVRLRRVSKDWHRTFEHVRRSRTETHRAAACRVLRANGGTAMGQKMDPMCALIVFELPPSSHWNTHQ